MVSGGLDSVHRTESQPGRYKGNDLQTPEVHGISGLGGFLFAPVHLGYETTRGMPTLGAFKVAQRVLGTPNFWYYALPDREKNFSSQPGCEEQRRDSR
jgi:hypothetical protein